MRGGVRKRGKKWYYYYDVVIGDKRKRIERVGGNTKREAEEALRKALDALETGYIAPTKTTLSDYLNDWVENFIKVMRKENTYVLYKKMVSMYISPLIGSVQLKDLQPYHIDYMINELAKVNLSNTTRQLIYRVLHSALERAVKLRIIKENPCRYVDGPKKDKFIANVLTEEEYYKILGLLDINTYNDYLFYLILQTELELGLRKGELLGLEWRDIDFHENLVIIRNNMVVIDGRIAVNTTKTEESMRTLYISDELKELLKNHKKRQIENRLKYGEHYQKNIIDGIEYDFVFTQENGKHIHPIWLNKKLRNLIKQAGINKRIRFHDLRHTNATFLLSQGVDLKTIQKRLGHARIQTTFDFYSHVTMEMQKKATDKIREILWWQNSGK
mgnify:CR=1 FL=1